jgi:hypothetical protein
MVGSKPHRQPVEGALASGRVEQGGCGERIGIEQARERQDLVREINEPVLIGPLTVGIVGIGAPQEIGRLPRLDRGLGLGGDFVEQWLV